MKWLIVVIALLLVGCDVELLATATPTPEVDTPSFRKGQAINEVGDFLFPDHETSSDPEERCSRTDASSSVCFDCMMQTSWSNNFYARYSSQVDEGSDRWVERYVGNGKWEVKLRSYHGWAVEWEVAEAHVEMVGHTWTPSSGICVW